MGASTGVAGALVSHHSSVQCGLDGVEHTVEASGHPSVYSLYSPLWQRQPTVLLQSDALRSLQHAKLLSSGLIGSKTSFMRELTDDGLVSAEAVVATLCEHAESQNLGEDVGVSAPSSPGSDD